MGQEEAKEEERTADLAVGIKLPKAKPLNQSNIRGHIFEVFVRILLEQNGWSVQPKGSAEKYKKSSPFWIELKGRGTWHQIDAPCVFERQIPFIYPLRLLSEMKFLKAHRGEVQKDQMREFLGVVKDVSENYFIDDSHSTDQDRFTEVGAFFSANGFQQEAVNLGFAHGVRTVSYRTNRRIADIKNGIDNLVSLGFPPKSMIRGTGRLARFKEELYDYMSGTEQNLNQFSLRQPASEDIRATLVFIRNALRGIRASFIGTTSRGVLLHFLGTDDFPDELFTETDIQPCRVFYDEPTETGIPMWLEFSNDPRQRRFYFDVPPGLENVIRKDGDVLGEKQKEFANIAVYITIRGLMRMLTLQLDLDWIAGLRNRRRRD